jgi:hypothetical protein
MNCTFTNEEVVFRNDGDAYFGVFESDSLRIALVMLSTIVLLFFLFPIYIVFIWYDYFGPHSERSILNRLISSLSETAMVFFIFVYFIDTSRYIFGPFSGKVDLLLKLNFEKNLL